MDENDLGDRSYTSRDEWEVMYRRGLSPAKIAETCNVPVATIKWTLGRRSREDPGLKTEHQNNAPQTPENTLTPLWAARLGEFQAFLIKHGRPPKAKGGDALETRLARWLRTQRRLNERGMLSKDRLNALDRSGSWRQSYRKAHDENDWQRQLVRLVDFRLSERRWPTWKKPSGESERQLGTWLHAQRQAASRGQLSQQRRKQLDTAAAGWNTWRNAREAT